MLVVLMRYWGWNGEPLVGYWLDGKIQLVTGSHRWAAAGVLDLLLIPVRVYSYEYIREVWGTDEWLLLVR